MRYPIAEGYSGQDLLSEFKSRQSKVRPAVEKMLKTAKDAANGIGEYYSYEDACRKTKAPGANDSGA